MVEKTLFQNIVYREEVGEIFYEDDPCVALCGTDPQVSTRVPIVPRKHIAALDDLTEEDERFIRDPFLVAQKVAPLRRARRAASAWSSKTAETRTRRCGTYICT